MMETIHGAFEVYCGTEYLGSMVYLGKELVKWLIFSDCHVYIAFDYVQIDPDRNMVFVEPREAFKVVPKYRKGKYVKTEYKKVDLKKLIKKVKRWT